MKFSLTFLLLFLSISAFGQKLEITHLTGNFYIFTTYHDLEGTPFPANGMYLVTDKGVAMFDTPWDETQFQPLLDSIQKRHNQKVVLCISTHFHADRTAGLEFYKSKDIKTFTSKPTDILSKKNGDKRAEFLFKKDTVFELGNYTFRTFYPGKGHSPDNIVILFDKEKIIYGGCFIKSTDNDNIGNLSDANPKAWLKSAKKLMDVFPNPQFVIPGHFGWSSNKSVEHTLKIIQEYLK